MLVFSNLVCTSIIAQTKHVSSQVEHSNTITSVVNSLHDGYFLCFVVVC